MTILKTVSNTVSNTTAYFGFPLVVGALLTFYGLPVIKAKYNNWLVSMIREEVDKTLGAEKLDMVVGGTKQELAVNMTRDQINKALLIKIQESRACRDKVEAALFTLKEY